MTAGTKSQRSSALMPAACLLQKQRPLLSQEQMKFTKRAFICIPFLVLRSDLSASLTVDINHYLSNMSLNAILMKRPGRSWRMIDDDDDKDSLRDGS